MVDDEKILARLAVGALPYTWSVRNVQYWNFDLEFILCVYITQIFDRWRLTKRLAEVIS